MNTISPLTLSHRGRRDVLGRTPRGYAKASRDGNCPWPCEGPHEYANPSVWVKERPDLSVRAERSTAQSNDGMPGSKASRSPGRPSTPYTRRYPRSFARRSGQTGERLASGRHIKRRRFRSRCNLKPDTSNSPPSHHEQGLMTSVAKHVSHQFPIRSMDLGRNKSAADRSSGPLPRSCGHHDELCLPLGGFGLLACYPLSDSVDDDGQEHYCDAGNQAVTHVKSSDGLEHVLSQSAC